MRKIFSLFASLVLVFVLVGCQPEIEPCAVATTDLSYETIVEVIVIEYVEVESIVERIVEIPVTLDLPPIRIQFPFPLTVGTVNEIHEDFINIIIDDDSYLSSFIYGINFYMYGDIDYSSIQTGNIIAFEYRNEFVQSDPSQSLMYNWILIDKGW